MKKFFYTVGFLLPAMLANSQVCRYMEEVFTDVQVTNDIMYGGNASVLEAPFVGEAIWRPLMLDLYEPANDTAEIRPLIIYFHSGNFLPYPDNQSVVGTRRDSSSVEWCKKLARCGYVVASADYRLGWNPLASTPVRRRIGIINAAYRGVQDARTCIRYFRKTALVDGNPYNIDESRIALFGDDTGGYLSTHASALDSFSEILAETQLYYLNDNGAIQPMITEERSGDVEGKSFGINSVQDSYFPFPVGDTLCYPNHVDYSSSFNVAINLAGAVVDTTWINIGEPPILNIHTEYDYTTPYGCDEIVNPPFIGPIMEVSGSGCIAAHQQTIGIDNWINIEPYSYVNDLQRAVDQIAANRSNGLRTLFPVIGDGLTDISPWEFWDRDLNHGDSTAILLNPNMSKEKAILYMDSILAFILPRMFVIQNLEDISGCELVGTQSVPMDDAGISVLPNVSTDRVHIRSSATTIKTINLVDSRGSLMRRVTDLNTNDYDFEIQDLASGMYFLQIQTEQHWTVAYLVVP